MVLHLGAVGLNAAAGSGASSSANAMPVNAAGGTPKFIRVAAQDSVYFAKGGASIAATDDDILIQKGDSVVLATDGATHWAAWGIGGAHIVVVTPLENSR